MSLKKGSIMDYLLDSNLQDAEARIMILLDRLIGDREFLHMKNKEIGETIGKSGNAIAKSVYRLARKGYLKIENPNIHRKIYILK
jgi:hypothetical protein